MYRILRNRSRANKADVTALTESLIRIPSLSREEQGVADVVESQMRALGYDSVTRDGAGNVVGVLFGVPAASLGAFWLLEQLEKPGATG